MLVKQKHASFPMPASISCLVSRFAPCQMATKLQNSHGALLHTCYSSERFQSSDDSWHLQLQQQHSVQPSFSFLPASVKIDNSQHIKFFIKFLYTASPFLHTQISMKTFSMMAIFLQFFSWSHTQCPINLSQFLKSYFNYSRIQNVDLLCQST